VHAANLLNAKTTRTPEGGAFKPKILFRKDDGSFDLMSGFGYLNNAV
jgi:hypothetical protein